jgi:hypothetical protein
LENIVKIWDCNFWVGNNNLSGKNSVSESGLAKILEHRAKKYHIVRTFLSHFDSFYYSPRHGNDNAANIVGKYPEQLYGILFLEQDLFFNPIDFLPFLKKRFGQGFRILRLLPKSHKYPFEKGLMKDFYAVLNQLRFPLLISLDEIDLTGNKAIAWEKILQITDSFQDIPVILDGADAKMLMFDSYIFAMLSASKNIYFTSHNMLGFNQIEDIAGFQGQNRVLFDSYAPFYREELSVFRLLHASLGHQDIQMIAKDNLEKMIKGIRI